MPPGPSAIEAPPGIAEALARDDLLLHFQPTAELASGRVTGVEALVRWRHPEHGLLGAPVVLAAVAEAGLLAELTDWVLEHALAQRVAWAADGLELTVAVNVAPVTALAEGFPERVASLLRRHDTEARWLVIEVTEDALSFDGAEAAAALGRLRTLGVSLSLDDFGTGWSSLGRLRRLPFDEIKIDRSFVAGMSGDEDDLAIVRTVLDLARHFERRVVAEGVEDGDQLAWLTALGCDMAQGFLLLPPVPAEELDAWVRRRGPGPPRPGAPRARRMTRPTAAGRGTADPARDPVPAALRRLTADADHVTGDADALLRRLLESLGWAAGVLWTADDRAVTLSCACLATAQPLADSAFERQSRTLQYRRGRGLPGVVWETSEAQWVTWTPEALRLPRGRAAKQAGLRGAFAAPVLADGRVVAVAELFAAEPLVPDERLRVALCDLLAGPFGATLHAAAERRAATGAERAAAAAAEAHTVLATGPTTPVARAAVCEAVLAATGASTVALWEPRGVWLAVTATAGVDVGRPTVPLTGETSAVVAAYASRRAAFFGDLARSPAVSGRLLQTVQAQSGLFLPMAVGEEPVGVMSVLWPRMRRRPGPAVRHTVEGLLAHAAAVLRGTDGAMRSS